MITTKNIFEVLNAKYNMNYEIKRNIVRLIVIDNISLFYKINVHFHLIY
jgi:hypothetical protein